MMETLRQLTAACGVSGNENEIRALLKELCLEAGAACRTDRLGTLLAQKDGGDASAPHLLLAAHMDEVGLIVRSAREDGLLRFAPVGGIDPRTIVSKAVLCGEEKIPGVIGAKAIHLQSPEDRANVLGFDKLFIDIGAKDKAEAERLCPIGTYCVFDSELTPIGEKCVVGRALDDRAGCLNLLRALKHGYRGKLTCAFTVQEEVGLRGAAAVSHHLDNDLAIVAETTTCNDLGDVPPDAQVCYLGKGVVVSHMDRASIAHAALRSAVVSVAEKKGIPCQPKRANAGGNDAGALQRGAGAKPTVVLSTPCRYIHSANSVACLDDIDAQGALLCALLDALPELWEEIIKSEVPVK